MANNRMYIVNKLNNHQILIAKYNGCVWTAGFSDEELNNFFDECVEENIDNEHVYYLDYEDDGSNNFVILSPKYDDEKILEDFYSCWGEKNDKKAIDDSFIELEKKCKNLNLIIEDHKIYERKKDDIIPSTYGWKAAVKGKNKDLKSLRALMKD